MNFTELKTQVHTLAGTTNLTELKNYITQEYPYAPISSFNFAKRRTWEVLHQILSNQPQTEQTEPQTEQTEPQTEQTEPQTEPLDLEESILEILKKEDFQPIPEIRKALGLSIDQLPQLHEAIYSLQRKDEIITVGLQDAWEFTAEEQAEGIDNGLGPIQFFLELLN